MRRLFAVTLLLLVSLTCTRKPEQEIVTTPKAAGPPASIGGTVRYRINRDVIDIAGFDVALKRGNETVKTASTDQFGTFHFDGMEPGTYTACWGGNGWDNGCTESLEVKQSDAAYAKEIGPHPTTPAAVIYGHVRLSDGGLPRFADADKVEVLDAAGKVLASAKTNANGEYITATAPGAVKARASAQAAKAESAQPPAPQAAGPREIDVTINNRRPDVSAIEILKGNQPATVVAPGDTITLRPTFSDPDKDALTYKWTVPPGAGTITSNPDGSATWTLPNYKVRPSAYFEVDDGKGGSTQRAVSLSVGGAATPTVSCPPPPGCQPLSLAAVPPPRGYSPGPPIVPPYFLTKKGTTDNSVAYYKAVDPNNLRLTLGNWWKTAGFDPTTGAGGVNTAYMNWNDLGFGRAMHFRQDSATKYVYAYVTNYGCPSQAGCNADLAAAADPSTAVATVCMEYSPVETDASKTPIVKFFVYLGGGASGARQGQADLDEWGPKPVPNLCMVCHGGAGQYNGGTQTDLGANFIPFDLAFLRYPPGGTATPPTADLPTYYQMNQMILATAPSLPIQNLIKGWYKSSTTIQDNNYVPVDWQKTGTPGNPPTLYNTVIAPGCRACHYSFAASGKTATLAWDSYSSATSFSSLIQGDVCSAGPIMPQAAVTYLNMWTNAYHFPTAPMDYLGSYSDTTGGWTSFGGCTGK